MSDSGNIILALYAQLPLSWGIYRKPSGRQSGDIQIIPRHTDTKASYVIFIINTVSIYPHQKQREDYVSVFLPPLTAVFSVRREINLVSCLPCTWRIKTNTKKNLLILLCHPSALCVARGPYLKRLVFYPWIRDVKSGRHSVWELY